MKHLKEILTTEFLENLIEVGRQYGWSGDYTEIGRFIHNCCTTAHNTILISHEAIEPYEQDEIDKFYGIENFNPFY